MFTLVLTFMQPPPLYIGLKLSATVIIIIIIIIINNYNDIPVYGCSIVQSTGRSAPTKEDKDNFKKVLQSIHGRLSIKMEYFRRYLQTHGEPDGFPRLENDLLFYLEVQKFKVTNKQRKITKQFLFFQLLSLHP